MTIAPPAPLPRLTLAVSGHRAGNAAFAANRTAIETAVAQLFDQIDAVVAAETASFGPAATTRLYTLLASGADQLAADTGLTRGWEIAAPLPFGRRLNLAINALPQDSADARQLLDGGAPADPGTAGRANQISAWYDRASLFELADQDHAIAPLFLSFLDNPSDPMLAQACTTKISERVARAGQVMIEHSDLLVAIWDGLAHDLVGGTGHTIVAALDRGAAVIWFDPGSPQHWRLLTSPESLSVRETVPPGDLDQLDAAVRAALRPNEGGALRRGADALDSEAWHRSSGRLASGYRRIEAVFGGEGRPWRSLRQTYETPDQIGSGSAREVVELAQELGGTDGAFAAGIEREVLRRHAWANGISSRHSDSYRSGMIANFLLSALAVAIGIAYQPLHREGDKWLFALGEFSLLCTIIAITAIGRRRRWHRRWFETRRVAEYFRHAPVLLLLGVARPTGQWPRGADTSWPEYYARHGLRALALPRVAIDAGYLRKGLKGLLVLHVLPQLDYHRAKARRLATVHHKLDRLSFRLFLLAVLSVSTWLVLAGGAQLGLVPHEWPGEAAKLFTFLGVLCPMLGASIAGIRYFGDFERFAAISTVTAGKLETLAQRIELLVSAPDERIDYAQAAELAHGVDRVVVEEIENWQAVFSGKNIAIPI